MGVIFLWVQSMVYALVHDDVIKWKYFPRHWPSVGGIHRSPVDSPHKGQCRGALVFSLICAWTNDWAHDWDAGDLRRHGAHYDHNMFNGSDVCPKVYNWAYHWNVALYLRYRRVFNRQRWLWAALWQHTRWIQVYMPQSWFHHWWWWSDTMCSWVRSIHILYIQWVVVLTRFLPNHQNRHPIARSWGWDKAIVSLNFELRFIFCFSHCHVWYFVYYR